MRSWTNFDMTAFWEVHIKILIPFFTHAHPVLRFACHTAPKVLVTRITYKEVMETNTGPTKTDSAGRS
jgi:hypothetical protein